METLFGDKIDRTKIKCKEARQILALRQRQAALMGAANYADLKLADTMAQTRDRVWALLDAKTTDALSAAWPKGEAA